MQKILLYILAAMIVFGAGGRAGAGCASLGDGYDISIPCVAYDGVNYSLALDYYDASPALTGYYWRFNLAGAGGGQPCGSLDDNFNLKIPCLDLENQRYYLDLEPVTHSSLPDGHYWKLTAHAASPKKMTLAGVKYWAYNIQDVDTERQRQQLVGSHFDMYVLEPVVTEKENESFDIAALIRDIRQHNIDARGVDPLILAYMDIGQAETWRWYYQDSWEVGNPDWIVAEDPDDWEGCYPAAFWSPDWRRIVITGFGGRSMVEESLKAGFDGIYMDWVEAFSDENVKAKAVVDGVEDTAAAMLDFIRDIRDHARTRSPNANPDYLVVAQNASDLYETDPARYREVIDAIALEGIWYDGDGGFDDWSDPAGYNMETNGLFPNWTEEVLAMLEPMKPHMPIFCVEYAQDAGGENLASRVYNTLAPAHGFIPYCTRRSLAQLSTSPHPAGYSPIDY
ncbi:MAG: hypothetical protein GY859_11930 [Desulfobacterales bacterium]|nr:hypothetical protein [Desulfobacterales bacterium]